MILLPHFDIPSGSQLRKIPQEFPFQGPVFFGLGRVKNMDKETDRKLCGNNNVDKKLLLVIFRPQFEIDMCTLIKKAQCVCDHFLR